MEDNRHPVTTLAKLNSPSQWPWIGKNRSNAHMPRFGVRLMATACRVKMRQGRGRKATVQSMGFFAVKFVEAGSPAEAIEEVKRRVHERLGDALANRSDEPWGLTVDDLWAVDDFYDIDAPQPGFIWYPEDADSDAG